MLIDAKKIEKVDSNNIFCVLFKLYIHFQPLVNKWFVKLNKPFGGMMNKSTLNFCLWSASICGASKASTPAVQE